MSPKSLIIDTNGDAVFHGQGPFLPITICIDTSGSMSSYEDELKQGFEQFYNDILSDTQTKRTALLQVITFDDVVEIVRDYQLVSENAVRPSFETGGCTDLVGAVEKALDSLNEQKQSLKAEGASYYQPWLVLLTDGEQCPENSLGIDSASNRVLQLCHNKELVCFPIGIGDNVNWNDLNKFSVAGSALRLKDSGSFKAFFKFFSASAHATSSSGNVQTPQFDQQAFFDAFTKGC